MPNKVATLKARRRKLAQISPNMQPTQPSASGDVIHLHELVGQATMLNLIGQRPIAFHRAYADLTGNVVAGLWLSHLLEMAHAASSEHFEGNDFVTSMSSAEIEAQTGISRGQQASCRKQLIEAGLMSEVADQRKKPVFRLHMDTIARKLMEQSIPVAMGLQAMQPKDADSWLERTA